MTDFRALCAELVSAWDDLPWEYDFKGNVTGIHGDLYDDSAVGRARAALAEPQPERPTREDAIAVYSQVMAAHQCETLGEMAEHFARAVLARWGTPNLSETRSSLGDAPQPVPVSERLPGDQLCWWYEPDEDDDGIGYGGKWTLLRIRGCVSCYTHWLPAHALPIPTVND